MIEDKTALDLVEQFEAWLTHASDHADTEQAWRCYVSPRHFASPDRRERAEMIGFGRSPRAAIENCFKILL